MHERMRLRSVHRPSTAAVIGRPAPLPAPIMAVTLAMGLLVLPFRSRPAILEAAASVLDGAVSVSGAEGDAPACSCGCCCSCCCSCCCCRCCSVCHCWSASCHCRACSCTMVAPASKPRDITTGCCSCSCMGASLTPAVPGCSSPPWMALMPSSRPSSLLGLCCVSRGLPGRDTCCLTLSEQLMSGSGRHGHSPLSLACFQCLHHAVSATNGPRCTAPL